MTSRERIEDIRQLYAEVYPGIEDLLAAIDEREQILKACFGRVRFGSGFLNRGLDQEIADLLRGGRFEVKEPK